MTTDPSTIAHGRVVTLQFRMYSPEGDLLDRTPDDRPLSYVHGVEAIVPGVSKRLEGESLGSDLNFLVPPHEAFGERRGPGPQLMSHSVFPKGIELSPGEQYRSSNDEGESVQFWVVAVDESGVLVDGEHPYVGMSIRFDVKVLDVRDATDEELKLRRAS